VAIAGAAATETEIDSGFHKAVGVVADAERGVWDGK